MKKTLLFAVCVLVSSTVFAQSNKVWQEVKKTDAIEISKIVERESFPLEFKLYSIDLQTLTQSLHAAPNRFAEKTSNVIITLPTAEGNFEKYQVFEASNFDAELQVQYPNIRSYVGIGIDNKHAQVRFSLDPRGIQAMVFKPGNGNEFIEPYSTNGNIYAVYKSSREKGKIPFTCSTVDHSIANDLTNHAASLSRSSTGVLLNFRLALSCTAEYSNYFGATSSAQSALVLAAFNATMTRVNGVFEKDFAIHMNLIAGTTNVIYYSATTDPYSDASVGTDSANSNNANGWNIQLQNALTSTIGNASYDIGHLFGASGGGGNAGCIGCVCVDDTASTTDKNKGSGFTSPGDGIPVGDTFDIDYVAHEMGHQFGANHTFSMSVEGAGVNIEVGSGSTIMGYAGITAQDVQSNSDDYFHAASIGQVQANMATKTCPTTVAITHSAPVVNAGIDRTIPISTPFILTGSATDAGGASGLTYCWEQMDNASGVGVTGANSAAIPTKLTGPNWRSYDPTTIPSRYMPRIQSVLANSATTAGGEINVEALSSVARTLNFRLTVRDNVAGQGQTNFDNMVVNVNASAGPFDVTSQNTETVWAPGSSQTITWTVNGTTALEGSANVDILLSTDGGLTYTTTLLSNTPNDGSQAITVPNISQPNCRVMVKPTGNIYFDINTKNIAIGNYTYETQNICTDYVFNANIPIVENSGSYSGYGFTITDSYTLTDINIKPNLTHPNAGNLYFGYRHPSQTTGVTRLSSGSCAGNANIHLWYDAQGTAVNCANTTSLAPTLPLDPFTPFIGLNSSGQWVFFLTDIVVGDGNIGTFNNITFNLCRSQQVPVLKSEYFGLDDFALYPNPNNGNFTIQFSANTSDEVLINVHDLRGRQVFAKKYQNNGLFNQELQLNSINSGVYLVTIQNGVKKEVRKIIVE